MLNSNANNENIMYNNFKNQMKMMSDAEFGSISFDFTKNQSNDKSYRVGGGGSNAINHTCLSKELKE
jgi:hypothetical protein